MLNQELTNYYFSFKNLNRERKQREVYLESMKKEAEQKKQQAERIDRRAVRCHTILFYFCVEILTTTTSNTKTCI